MLGPARRVKVFVHGEYWDADTDEPLAVGDAVEVAAREGPAPARAPARRALRRDESHARLRLTTVLVFGVALLLSGLKMLNEFERGVVFRLGRLVGARGPGMIYVIPLVERMERVDLRTVTMDVPPQDVITKDNVSVKVNAVLYFRVVDPRRAIVEVVDYLFATSQLAQTTLRSVCGQRELDELLADARADQPAHPGDPRHPDRSLGHQGRRRSRSSTSTCRRRCSAPWRARPRPSASAAPR